MCIRQARRPPPGRGRSLSWRELLRYELKSHHDGSKKVKGKSHSTSINHVVNSLSIHNVRHTGTHHRASTPSNGKGNASLIIHSTDSIMVYPLVTTQGKKKEKQLTTNEQCSAVQNVKEMRSESLHKPS